MFKTNSKYILVCGLLMLCTAVLCSTLASADQNDLKTTVMAENYFSQLYTVKNEDLLPNNNRDFTLQSNATVNVYFLGAMDFAAFLANGTLPATPSKTNTTEIQEFWSADLLHEKYGLEIKIANDKSEYVEVYVLVINAHTDQNAQIIMRLNYTPYSLFLGDVKSFVKFSVVAIYMAVGGLLLKRSLEAKKDNNMNLKSILQGQGTAYILVGLIFFLAELRVYIENEIGTTSANFQRIEFTQKGLPINYYDVFVASIFLSAAAVFMALGWVVEKNVKHRKIPIVTFNLLAAALLSLLVFVVPSIVVFALTYLIISVIIATVQVIFIYLEMVIKTSGRLRRNSLFILLGIIIPLFAFVTRMFLFSLIREFYETKAEIYILTDLLALLGVFFFYQGNMSPESD